ncbi:MAG TPA: hypothetical protein VMW16_13030 [Sedimentisphaerales bacterium]|nr:hypothetical protein [Sedimentisphaerales bacterium]
MKSFSRTIAVFVVLSLAMVGVVMAEEAAEPVKPQQPKPVATAGVTAEDEMAAGEQEMREAEKELNRAAKKMEMAAGQQEMTEAQKEMERASRRAERAMDEIARKMIEIDASQRERQRQWAALPLDTYAGPVLGGDAHAGRVLVIPAERIKTKPLVTIMEDLSVMARILDKKLGRSQDYSVFGNLSVFSDARGGTQCIYVDGYGALFFIRVDFPLAPSVQTQEQEETEEPADRVWEETRQEIFAGPGAISRRRICVQQDREPRYDADKVEELKRNLIKSLRHAANIRALEPDQWLIVTVIGASQPRNISMVAVARTSSVIVHDKDQNVTKIYAGGVPTDIASSSPTVMTIRAKKVDADAFAAGELDLDAFREKVQIYTY